MRLKFKNTSTGDEVLNIELLPSQKDFWTAEERYVLFSGGIGCGKSMTMLLKVIYDCMSQDDNYFLVGRATYGEIHDVMIKEFFELCHDSWIKTYKKTPHPSVVLHTFNGGTSEIIFRNLDKMSKGELLGLNLGGFAIDQAEDVPEEIFNTLKGRLRRKKIDHRVYMTSNPKLSWLYRAFKQHPEDNYRLIEGSTLENKENLPEEYVADLENYPESWYKQYVLGIWDESLLGDNIVFSREQIERLNQSVRPPKKMHEDLRIYEEYDKDCEYQMGIDSAEGAESTEESMRKSQKDSAVIVIWNVTKQTEAAMYSGKVPPRVLAEKAVRYAALYNDPMMIPEMNSMGAALIDKLHDLGYSRIYRREEYDRVLKKRLKKVGFRMTASSKMLLISYFDELLRVANPVIRSEETVEEMKTFIYSDTAKKKGAGAQEGFHDDKIIATMLAAFSHQAPKKGKVHSEKHDTLSGVQTVPSVTVVNGRWRPPQAERTVSWKRL